MDIVRGALQVIWFGIWVAALANFMFYVGAFVKKEWGWTLPFFDITVRPESEWLAGLLFWVAMGVISANLLVLQFLDGIGKK